MVCPHSSQGIITAMKILSWELMADLAREWACLGLRKLKHTVVASGK